MNLLSVGAAYGVMVAVFQWGWAGRVIGIGETGPIDPWIPVTMFTILFGLSMDYEVFLLSRIREEWLRTQENSAAVADGLAVTGRIITAAAAIMFCVFASFVIKDPLHILKVFGLGLAVAVLVDATLVRMVLVPSIMELLGPVNWWMPRWLDRSRAEDRRGGDARAARRWFPRRPDGLGRPPRPARMLAPMSIDRSEQVRDGRPAPVSTFVSLNPGRDVQRVGTATFLGEDVGKIHDPVWAVIGNLGDSQCYLGVPEKVQAVQSRPLPPRRR